MAKENNIRQVSVKNIIIKLTPKIELLKEHIKFKGEDFVTYSAIFEGRKITRSSVVAGETVLKIINELKKELDSRPS